MSGLVRMSEAASLALHAMVYLAASRDGPVTTRKMARTLDVSENHLSKVLQRLAKFGLVKSVRGRNGGYELAKAASRIALLDVFESIEGPLEPTRCLFERRVCRGEICILGGLLKTLGDETRKQLSRARLSDFEDFDWRSGENAQASG